MPTYFQLIFLLFTSKRIHVSACEGSSPSLRSSQVSFNSFSQPWWVWLTRRRMLHTGPISPSAQLQLNHRKGWGWQGQRLMATASTLWMKPPRPWSRAASILKWPRRFWAWHWCWDSSSLKPAASSCSGAVAAAHRSWHDQGCLGHSRCSRRACVLPQAKEPKGF